MDLKDEMNEKLRESCCMGDGEAIYKCLLQGADINSKNKVNGWTPLHWAAKRGHTKLVQLLLESNADPSIKNNSEQTPYDIANSEQVKAVIQNYRDRLQANVAFTSPLHPTQLKSQEASQEENEAESVFVLSHTRNIPIPREFMQEPSSTESTPESKRNTVTETVTERVVNGPKDFQGLGAFTPVSRKAASQEPVKLSSELNQLNFVPNYLANPVFPYVSPKESRIPSFGKISTNVTREDEELVLKVRHANSEEQDFIEIELNKNELTIQNLQDICLRELGIIEYNLEIQKIRKLPNTILRKDKDVKRLGNYQEIEIVTRLTKIKT